MMLDKDNLKEAFRLKIRATKLERKEKVKDGDEEDDGTGRKVREIQFKKDESLKNIIIPVRIGNKRVNAIIDTAAQVSLISEDLVRSLRKPIKTQEAVRLVCAGKVTDYGRMYPRLTGIRKDSHYHQP